MLTICLSSPASIAIWGRRLGAEEEALDLDRSGLNSLSGGKTVDGLPDLGKPQFHPS